jgi:hypothetical protein
MTTIRRNWLRQIWDAKWYLLLVALFLVTPIAGIIILIALVKYALRYLFGG